MVCVSPSSKREPRVVLAPRRSGVWTRLSPVSNILSPGRFRTTRARTLTYNNELSWCRTSPHVLTWRSILPLELTWPRMVFNVPTCPRMYSHIFAYSRIFSHILAGRSRVAGSLDDYVAVLAGVIVTDPRGTGACPRFAPAGHEVAGPSRPNKTAHSY